MVAYFPLIHIRVIYGHLLAYDGVHLSGIGTKKLGERIIAIIGSGRNIYTPTLRRTCPLSSFMSDWYMLRSTFNRGRSFVHTLH